MLLKTHLQASFSLNLCGMAACKITHKDVSQATRLGATSGGMWVIVPSEFVSMRDEAMLRARPKSAQHTHCKKTPCAAFQTGTSHIHCHTNNHSITTVKSLGYLLHSDIRQLKQPARAPPQD